MTALIVNLELIYYEILKYISRSRLYPFPHCWDDDLAGPLAELIYLYANVEESLDFEFPVFTGFIACVSTIISKLGDPHICELCQEALKLPGGDATQHITALFGSIMIYIDKMDGDVVKNNYKQDIFNFYSEIIRLVDLTVLKYKGESFSDQCSLLQGFVFSYSPLPLKIRMAKNICQWREIFGKDFFPEDTIYPYIQEGIEYLGVLLQSEGCNPEASWVFKEMKEFITVSNPVGEILEMFLSVLPQDPRFICRFIKDFILQNNNPEVTLALISHFEEILVGSLDTGIIEVDTFLIIYSRALTISQDSEDIGHLHGKIHQLLTDLEKSSVSNSLHIITTLILKNPESLNMFKDVIIHFLSDDITSNSDLLDNSNTLIDYLNFLASLNKKGLPDDCANRALMTFFNEPFLYALIEISKREGQRFIEPFLRLINIFIPKGSVPVNREIVIRSIKILADDFFFSLWDEPNFKKKLCVTIYLTTTFLSGIDLDISDYIPTNFVTEVVNYILRENFGRTPSVYIWAFEYSISTQPDI
mgnify:CR=1 FL=1